MVILITGVIKDIESALFGLKDTMILPSLESLKEELSKQPLDITTLMTTSDVFSGNVKETSKLYFDILEDKFIKVGEKYHFINNENSDEVKFLKFRDPSLKVKRVSLHTETLVSILQGKVNIAQEKSKSFTVYRYSKKDYVKGYENTKILKDSDFMSEIDNSDIESIGDIQENHYVLPDLNTQVYTNVYTCESRSEAINANVLIGMHLARNKKVVIIEDDLEYLDTYYTLDKSRQQFKAIDIREFLKNTKKFLETLFDEEGVIIFTALHTSPMGGVQLEKSFYKSVLTTLLRGHCDYILHTSECTESSYGKTYITLPTNVVKLLRVLKDLPKGTPLNIIGCNMSSVEETEVSSVFVYKELLQELVGNIQQVNLIKLDSLKGGDLVGVLTDKVLQ